MSDDIAANLIGIENPDVPIFHFISFDRGFEILKQRKLVLSSPSKWPDPFENILFRQPIEWDGQQVSIGSLSLYASCWTLLAESDALWRIYSSDKKGIRIRSTPRKLLKAIAASPGIHAGKTTFFGKVTYVSQSELVQMLDDSAFIKKLFIDESFRGHAKSILFKRNEFSHEAEARLIFAPKDGLAPCPPRYEPFCAFSIDPPQIIDEITLDPRLGFREFMELSAKICDLEFPPGKINRSRLYKHPRDKRKEWDWSEVDVERHLAIYRRLLLSENET